MAAELMPDPPQLAGRCTRQRAHRRVRARHGARPAGRRRSRRRSYCSDVHTYTPIGHGASGASRRPRRGHAQYGSAPWRRSSVVGTSTSGEPHARLVRDAGELDTYGSRQSQQRARLIASAAAGHRPRGVAGLKVHRLLVVLLSQMERFDFKSSMQRHRTAWSSSRCRAVSRCSWHHRPAFASRDENEHRGRRRPGGAARATLCLSVVEPDGAAADEHVSNYSSGPRYLAGIQAVRVRPTDKRGPMDGRCFIYRPLWTVRASIIVGCKPAK